MVSRKISKELVTFLRREVKAKKAEWGELYKLKSISSVRKGLPNLPSLTILSEPWLSYIIAIKSGREVRLYYYNNLGVLQHGDTFKKEEMQILELIQNKSKKLHRYPIKKKKLSIVDVTKQYDLLFLNEWNQITNAFKISKKRRRNRPLIKVITNSYPGIFDTEIRGNFIFVPLNSPHLQQIFTYYSFYFLLPTPIKENPSIAESLALRIYDSYKKNDPILQQVTLNGNIMRDTVDEWKEYPSQKILSFLDRLCLYNTEKWENSDFHVLRNLSLTEFPNVSRNNLHRIYCQISKKTGNPFLSLLAAIMAFSFGENCSIFQPDESEISQIYFLIQQGRLKRILHFLKENSASIPLGIRKAIMEALEYWYSNILEILSDSNNPYEYIIKNRSDLTIIIDNAKLISSTGITSALSFQKHVILPDLELNLSFSSYTKESDAIISLNYYLKENNNNFSPVLFTGEIKLG